MVFKNGLYYLNPVQKNENDDPIYIRGVGIREIMGALESSFQDISQYVLMFFHDQAHVNIGKAPPQEAKNSFILWDGHTLNTYGNLTQQWCHTWLVVGGSSVDILVKRMKFEVNHIYRHAELEDQFKQYCLSIYREMTRSIVPDRQMLGLLLEIMFHDINRMLHHENDNAIPPVFRDLVEYLDMHLEKQYSLSSLARMSFLSVPRFCALFQSYFGQSPVNYLNQKRMVKGAHLLRTTSLQIREIAALCGFPNALYFSNRFHKHWKVSPREYRGKSISNAKN